jgi:endonuclease YncB( thermonuclease family)
VKLLITICFLTIISIPSFAQEGEVQVQGDAAESAPAVAATTAEEDTAEAPGREHTGTVVNVADGDIFTLKTEGELGNIKIRLAGIDAPELEQPFGELSRKRLSSLIFAKDIRVEQVDVDNYGRVIGQVFLPDPLKGTELNINQFMVYSGAAWVWPEGAASDELYKLEQLSKAKKYGIWSLPDPDRTPPWEYRAELESKRKPMEDSGMSHEESREKIIELNKPLEPTEDEGYTKVIRP